jgi:hypothetical protein
MLPTLPGSEVERWCNWGRDVLLLDRLALAKNWALQQTREK